MANIPSTTSQMTSRPSWMRHFGPITDQSISHLTHYASASSSSHFSYGAIEDFIDPRLREVDTLLADECLDLQDGDVLIDIILKRPTRHDFSEGFQEPKHQNSCDLFDIVPSLTRSTKNTILPSNPPAFRNWTSSDTQSSDSESHTSGPGYKRCSVPGCGVVLPLIVRVLENHSAIHRPKNHDAYAPCPWPGCESRPLKADSFRRHLAIHFETFLTCPYCDRPFARKDSLARHFNKTCPEKENTDREGSTLKYTKPSPRKPARRVGGKRARAVDESSDDDGDDDDYKPAPKRQRTRQSRK
ncbi:unnamed protein product [Somion occarium]|uniref:C2H2-type domain-containing protein n=1 Tax=Somion occarium TaxID=3059160 RepID=A0ABP1DSJ8_9APHY